MLVWGSEIPKQYFEFIEEWKILNPEFILKRWDETISPMDNAYVIEARKNNNWANISNYIRFYALLQHGGIYLDTDIKLLKPLDELLLNKCFFGFEEGDEVGSTLFVNNAIMGAEKKSSLY